MQQRGGREPWHQRGVLDRIPEPEAAPAKRVIGPVGAHRYAKGQGNPGDQRPGPHETREDRVDAARNQSRRREGISDRKSDIAEIKQRRVDGEARILEERVQIIALRRRPGDAREGIRC